MLVVMQVGLGIRSELFLAIERHAVEVHEDPNGILTGEVFDHFAMSAGSETGNELGADRLHMIFKSGNLLRRQVRQDDTAKLLDVGRSTTEGSIDDAIDSGIGGTPPPTDENPLASCRTSRTSPYRVTPKSRPDPYTKKVDSHDTRLGRRMGRSLTAYHSGHGMLAGWALDCVLISIYSPVAKEAPLIQACNHAIVPPEGWRRNRDRKTPGGGKTSNCDRFLMPESIPPDDMTVEQLVDLSPARGAST